jgi:hypothetical protein
VTPQERQRSLVEFLDALVKRRVRTPVEHEQFGIRDAALQPIGETGGCELIARPDRDVRRSENSYQMGLHIVREDPEPLYFWASDLAYCGHTKPAIQLLRESIRRNFCAVTIETDPMFAAIRNRTEYVELLAAAQACRDRFREHVNRVAIGDGK